MVQCLDVVVWGRVVLESCRGISWVLEEGGTFLAVFVWFGGGLDGATRGLPAHIVHRFGAVLSLSSQLCVTWQVALVARQAPTHQAQQVCACAG